MSLSLFPLSLSFCLAFCRLLVFQTLAVVVVAAVLKRLVSQTHVPKVEISCDVQQTPFFRQVTFVRQFQFVRQVTFCSTIPSCPTIYIFFANLIIFYTLGVCLKMKCIGQFFLSNIFQNSPELKYALKACSEVIYERKKTEF